MTESTVKRVSKNFDELLKELKRNTHLSEVQITDLLAYKMRKWDRRRKRDFFLGF